ncbi:MAG: FliM/FliN family flagellar motor switch protein [Mariprofundaceae bacterium]|nr:FliM/FliN family flagellar motor switch protein [Mariprofundaceae bacterium]
MSEPAPQQEGPVLEPEEVAALMENLDPNEETQAILASLPPMPQPEHVEIFTYESGGSEGPERYPLFGSVQERMAEAIKDSWKEIFQRQIDLDAGNATMTHYEEIIESDKPNAYLVFDHPGFGLMLVVISINLTVAYVDALLGGSGEAYGESAEVLSPVEQRLCKRLAREIEHIMTAAWKPVYPMDFILKKIETDPQFLGVAANRDLCFSTSYHIKLNDNLEGDIAFHFPRTFLDPILEMLRSNDQDKPDSVDDEWSLQLRQGLQGTPLTLRLEMGSLQMNIAQFLALKSGDQLPLSKRATDMVELWVESEPVFRAIAGQKDGWLAAEIKEPYHHGGEL